MRSSKLRFGWLDALILAVVFGLLGYVLHRAHSHFHYNWDWRLIPGYFLRFDADRGGCADVAVRAPPCRAVSLSSGR